MVAGARPVIWRLKLPRPPACETLKLAVVGAVVVAQQTAGQAEILQGVRQGDVLLRGNTQMLRNALDASKDSSQN